MDNIRPQGAEIEINGKKYRMLFVNKSASEIKKQHGTFSGIFKKIYIDGDIEYGILADLVYQGLLINKDEALTKDIVVDWVNNLTMSETNDLMANHLTAAIHGYYPKVEGEPKKD